MSNTPAQARTTYFFDTDRIWTEKTNPKDKNPYLRAGGNGLGGQNGLNNALGLGIGPCKPSIRALETILGFRHRVA